MEDNKCITHTSLTLHLIGRNRKGLSCIHKNNIIPPPPPPPSQPSLIALYPPLCSFRNTKSAPNDEILRVAAVNAHV